MDDRCEALSIHVPPKVTIMQSKDYCMMSMYSTFYSRARFAPLRRHTAKAARAAMGMAMPAVLAAANVCNTAAAPPADRPACIVPTPGTTTPKKLMANGIICTAPVCVR